MLKSADGGLRAVPFPVDDPERIPVGRYFNEEFYKLELEHLWPHVWQMACRLEQIPDVGDWVEYSNAGRAVIVVRTASGVVDQASGFVSRVFFQMPALADFFRVIDHQSTVLDRPDGLDIGRARGEVDFEDLNFSYDGLRPALQHFNLHVPAGTTVAVVATGGDSKLAIRSRRTETKYPITWAIGFFTPNR